ncbi:hypothetical protein, partial [Oceanobacillus massiliensis]
MKDHLKKGMDYLKEKNKWLLILLPVSLLGIYFFFMTLSNVHTETYDIERFSNANVTIRSPI